MGFSFVPIEDELASERFTGLYRRLQVECPRLAAYPSAAKLIAFFNDTTQDYAEKDEILSFLITAYQRGGPGRLLSGFFIILFRPAIASLYRLARKRDSRLDEAEFIQEVCAFLLEIIATVQVQPQKVATQIVGPLRNRVRDRMNRKLAHNRMETSWHGDREGQESEAADSAHDYGLPATFPAEDIPRKEQGEAGDWQAYSLPDAEVLLAGLVREGIINAGDRGLIYETVMKERPLKDLTTDPTEYQRLKKRRQRALLAIREHLRNSSK
jgi:hypothetical protein